VSKKTYLTNKIVLIGDARVGKTSLVRRFVSNMFDPSYKITLGTTIMKKEVDYLTYNVTLAIWDIGGQEVFRQIRSKYFFGSKGALAKPLSDFAVSYADQAEADYQLLVNAVKSGKVEAETGI